MNYVNERICSCGLYVDHVCLDFGDTVTYTSFILWYPLMHLSSWLTSGLDNELVSLRVWNLYIMVGN